MGTGWNGGLDSDHRCPRMLLVYWLCYPTMWTMQETGTAACDRNMKRLHQRLEARQAKEPLKLFFILPHVCARNRRQCKDCV